MSDTISQPWTPAIVIQLFQQGPTAFPKDTHSHIHTQTHIKTQGLIHEHTHIHFLTHVSLLLKVTSLTKAFEFSVAV